MTEREALKLALDYIVATNKSSEFWLIPASNLNKTVTAIKEALAQPEQELLAWKNAALRVGEDLSSVGPKGYYNMTAQQWLDWAMAQQPRGNNSLAQPEQERCEYCKRGLKTMCLCGMKAQPEQEPVTWGVDWGRAGQTPCVSIIKRLNDGRIEVVAVEYGPQRTWVGLTHSDIDQGLLRSDYAFKTAEAWRAGVVFAMTKLKQKNGYDS